AYAYGYDTAGRRVSETAAGLGTVSWTLDANGKIRLFAQAAPDCCQECFRTEAQ
ncbi:hypothetical protein ACFW16_33955, partial [Inquilinus sp. NPDC058860]|uniref:hypothetical protein n=1 Tax=Inquilinus sp. NPDC058860 TaxID=3346652 RepID=UPI00367C9792